MITQFSGLLPHGLTLISSGSLIMLITVVKTLFVLLIISNFRDNHNYKLMLPCLFDEYNCSRLAIAPSPLGHGMSVRLSNSVLMQCRHFPFAQNRVFVSY